MADTLLRTKLRMPPVRPGVVDRPRLLVRAAEGLTKALTLIAAPAGFGKTTLAAAAVAASGMPVAWLTLVTSDNQADRFLSYLVAACQTADPALGQAEADLLAGPQPPPGEAVLTGLLNDLDSTARPLALVLDDYYVITNQTIHSAVSYLLDQRPPNLHLLITTRADPPLPVARLRARNQLVELRANDLRFTLSEATAFLNETMGAGLSLPQVAALAERTDGWITGLQMAALSLRERSDVRDFIANFSGAHGYVLDYLLDEVLAGLPADLHGFLLRTSVLERFCAPLCDAVMAADDERIPSPGRRAVALLEDLHRRHLFIVSLDDEGRWHRYHPLFADLLRARLSHLAPGMEPQLRGRAAAWFEAEGMPAEAISHYVVAGDVERAARLVETHTADLLARGELSALMGWVEALPSAARASRPQLCIHQAYPLAFAGRLAEAGALVDQAEVALAEAGAAPDGLDGRALRGAIVALRAMLTVMTGRDDARGALLASQALALLHPDQAWDRATAAWALGYAERSLGRLDPAQDAFEEQIALARRIGNVWTLVTGLTDLAMVLRTRGRLSEARMRLEEALDEAQRQGARSLGYIARAEAALVSVLYEQNALDQARGLLNDALAHVRLWPNPNHEVFALVLQARMESALCHDAAAQAALTQAATVLRGAPVSGIVKAMLESALVGACFVRSTTVTDLMCGEAAAILNRWQEEASKYARRTATETLRETDVLAFLTIARVYLARGQSGPAQDVLERLAPALLADQRIGAAIEVLALLALAHQASLQRVGNSSPELALSALERSLELAGPGGYTRVFLDLGPAFAALLARWLAHAPANHTLRAYAVRLLAAYEGEAPREAGQQTQAEAGGLVEPLSQRELEVLYLLAQGLSNQAIAGHLVVATGTVKAHTANIYRKLDAANRTAAVTRARALGILP